MSALDVSAGGGPTAAPAALRRASPLALADRDQLLRNAGIAAAPIVAVVQRFEDPAPATVATGGRAGTAQGSVRAEVRQTLMLTFCTGCQTEWRFHVRWPCVHARAGALRAFRSPLQARPDRD